jgi:hypothetical protein
MPRAGFEHTIPAFEPDALDRVDTVIGHIYGTTQHNTANIPRSATEHWYEHPAENMQIVQGYPKY